MKVLIVEDERDLGKTPQGVLEREGFVVETAADGEEGLYMAAAVRLMSLFSIFCFQN